MLMQAADMGKPPEQTSRFYVKGALEYLVPILLLTLAKQVSTLCVYAVYKNFECMCTITRTRPSSLTRNNILLVAYVYIHVYTYVCEYVLFKPTYKLP